MVSSYFIGEAVVLGALAVFYTVFFTAALITTRNRPRIGVTAGGFNGGRHIIVSGVGAAAGAGGNNPGTAPPSQVSAGAGRAGGSDRRPLRVQIEPAGTAGARSVPSPAAAATAAVEAAVAPTAGAAAITSAADAADVPATPSPIASPTTGLITPMPLSPSGSLPLSAVTYALSPPTSAGLAITGVAAASPKAHAERHRPPRATTSAAGGPRKPAFGFTAPAPASSPAAAAAAAATAAAKKGRSTAVAVPQSSDSPFLFRMRLYGLASSIILIAASVDWESALGIYPEIVTWMYSVLLQVVWPTCLSDWVRVNSNVIHRFFNTRCPLWIDRMLSLTPFMLFVIGAPAIIYYSVSDNQPLIGYGVYRIAQCILVFGFTIGMQVIYWSLQRALGRFAKHTASSASHTDYNHIRLALRQLAVTSHIISVVFVAQGLGWLDDVFAVFTDQTYVHGTRYALPTAFSVSLLPGYGYWVYSLVLVWYASPWPRRVKVSPAPHAGPGAVPPPTGSANGSAPAAAVPSHGTPHASTGGAAAVTAPPPPAPPTPTAEDVPKDAVVIVLPRAG